jgi:electron transport complex protein RnfC
MVTTVDGAGEIVFELVSPNDSGRYPELISVALRVASRPLVPLVRLGQIVKCGAEIGRMAEPDPELSKFRLRAPLGGEVAAIERVPDPGAAEGTSVQVSIRVDPGCTNAVVFDPIDLDHASTCELLGRIDSAGLVGRGGAGFPVGTKIRRAVAERHLGIIVNAVECEPPNCSDRALGEAELTNIEAGMRALTRMIAPQRVVFAAHHPQPWLTRAADECNAQIHLESRSYPAGDERQLIRSVEFVGGRLTEPLIGPPIDSSVAQGTDDARRGRWTTFNLATVAAIGEAIGGTLPSHRWVTVAHAGVQQEDHGRSSDSPSVRVAVVRTPIGASLGWLVDCAGFDLSACEKIWLGGVHTAQLATRAAVVEQTTYAVLTGNGYWDSESRRPVLPCIRCGRCQAACPQSLLPQLLYQAATGRDRAELGSLGIDDCTECGLCDWVCPSHIPLARAFRRAKWRERERADAEHERIDALERYARHEKVQLRRRALQRERLVAGTGSEEASAAALCDSTTALSARERVARALARRKG